MSLVQSESLVTELTMTMRPAMQPGNSLCLPDSRIVKTMPYQTVMRMAMQIELLMRSLMTKEKKMITTTTNSMMMRQLPHQEKPEPLHESVVVNQLVHCP